MALSTGRFAPRMCPLDQGAPIRRELDPRDILTEEDVYKLVRAAPTTRDKALIHVLYESGARINELQRRSIRDVSFEYIGEDDPTLTAILFIPSRGTGIGKEQGKYLRLIDSAPILQAWLQDHPNPEPDQPLWVSLHSHFGKRLGRSTIRKMLKRVAKQCGVTKPVHPHAFQHAQVTRSAKYLSDQQLKQKFGWAPGLQMLKVYSHLTTQDVEEKEFELRGITPKQDKRTRVLTQVQCAGVTAPIPRAAGSVNVAGPWIPILPPGGIKNNSPNKSKCNRLTKCWRS